MRRIALLDQTAWAPVLLAWSYAVLLPFGRVSNLSVLLMAIAGGVLLWRQGRGLMTQGPNRYFGLLFLCIWLPMLVSVPDSVNLNKSLTSTALFPYLYLVGLFLIHSFREPTARTRLLTLTAWLLVFWVVDVLIQAVLGVDVFGFEPKRERLQGPFGEENLNMGLVLAMLSPLLFEHARRAWPRWAWVAAFVAVTLVVLLSSTRTAWAIYLLVVIGTLVVMARRSGANPWRLAGVALLASFVAGYVAYLQVPIVTQRLDQTLLATQGSYDKVNAATSSRLSLWKGTWRVIVHHPVNGAGVRAFRYAYPLYAPEGDTLLYTSKSGEVTGEIYAHQILLEVASETGIVGLGGLAFFYVLLVRRPWRRAKNGIGDDWPYWLGAAAWLFPLSTHTAFYSSYWSHLLWWLLAIAVAAGWGRQDDGKEPAPSHA